ncbi:MULTISPECIES: FimB/Mfa2 family fimbrial subunit [Butyricimonas]|uniref:FimB/Mfa2 family fimbrial subunit n=1 Tax=Butyricimonas hominis TaxID=2763032 RepID=A0ABR7D2Y6_9BACT|nr:MULTISPECIES: FimB/Mfa2 family fimbrial subunit [Butyricimonas]MBC5622122.1 FimB/Mfa2 family fimbrial subunit [Butyricimonas hominis]
MKFKNLLRQIALGILVIIPGIFHSCDSIREDLKECRLLVRFKYDYNMLSTDAFHTQVDKVDLYVFDEEGKFLFMQSEEGTPLTTGDYRMELFLPIGQYKLLAWAGVHDSYEVTNLEPGVSTFTEIELKLKREASLVVNKQVEPLWYGELADVDFTGIENTSTTINLIKNTNTIRFVFENLGTSNFDVNDYTYELSESNGYMGHDNALKPDDVLSYQPYHINQSSATTGVIELNTMRLMTDRLNNFTVKDKNTGATLFNVDLTDFFLLLRHEEHKNKWGDQEYLDRKDAYDVVFYLSGSTNAWLSISVIINGWTWYLQEENH